MRKGLTGATGNLYCGLHDYQEMLFLLHFLREEDLFVDIGANIGSYTILASGENRCESICFEPVRNTFEILKKNIEENKVTDKAKAYNMAVGSKKGEIKFTEDFDTVNHVAVNGENGIVVAVDALDNLIKFDKKPILIKIDVEGYETEVINGSSETLENNQLKAIIIELNGSGNRYGYDENLIREKLLAKGFKPFEYDPKTRILIESDGHNMNVIYIRDVDFVKLRLQKAERVRILNQSY